MAKEQWCVIPDTNGFYEVSDMGKVRSYAKHVRNEAGQFYVTKSKKPKLKSIVIQKNGYPYVGLSLKKKYQIYTVHGLILNAFIGAAPKGFQAAHLDGSRKNSILSNLKWVTPKENMRHKKLHGTQTAGETCPTSKYTEYVIRSIFDKSHRGWKQKEIAKYFMINPAYISEIFNRKVWGHLRLS